VTIRYAEGALADLEAILAYLNEKSPRGGRNVMRSIQKTANLIGEFPQRGRLAGEGNVRVARAGRYPYLIYWDAEGDDATIVHIRHAARKPWAGAQAP
jgi:plasmid stabilization system protein ParE